MGRHVLNHAGFAAFDAGDAVVVAFGAGVDIHSLVDRSRQIGLGSLASEVGAGYLDL